MKNVVESLFPLIRRLLLGELVRAEGESVHIQELARRVGKEAKSVYNELKNLESAGIVISQRQGNQVQYSLNPQCPIYPELKMLIIKTVGLADVLRDALKPLAAKIKVAFIYGSFARGKERADSDVDVMVIGDVSFGEVVDVLYDTQKVLSREVNPSVYPVAEYLEKRAAGHHFIKEVIEGAKIFLIGDADELAEMV
ncbi:nucleotidyltransferase domain-containing protein [bacterium]|nr:nucleotidyltransferase domain-containing protein [bacterium]